jgi:hypothetical protein
MFGQENTSRSSARAASTSPPMVPQAGSGRHPSNSSTFAASMLMMPIIPPAHAAARLASTASCPTVAPTTRYPGVAEIAGALEDAMARWKNMPGPAEWCGTLFDEMRHGVCMQMLVNQKKRGAKGQAWKDFYKLTFGIRTG